MWAFSLVAGGYSLVSVPELLIVAASVVELWLWGVRASMGFSRQEYWSGLPFPSPGDLPNPGIEPKSPTLQVDTLTSEPPGNLSE